MVVKYDLADEMSVDAEVIALLADIKIATEFYSAITNMKWVKVGVLPEDEAIIEKLLGIDTTTWSTSWRSAGFIIANIRNKHYNSNEDYMDFYCMGNEGDITDVVLKCFNRMGWKPEKWEDRV